MSLLGLFSCQDYVIWVCRSVAAGCMPFRVNVVFSCESLVFWERKSDKSKSLWLLSLKERRERMLSFTKSEKSDEERFALLFWADQDPPQLSLRPGSAWTQTRIRLNPDQDPPQPRPGSASTPTRIRLNSDQDLPQLRPGSASTQTSIRLYQDLYMLYICSN